MRLIQSQSARAVIFLVTLLTCFPGCGQKQDNSDPRSAADTTSAALDSVVLIMVASDSTTVLDLTRFHHDVESRASALGAFVTAIDSIENSRRAFWVYSVNDSTPLVAADKQLVVPGDTVRWHLRFSDPTP